VHDHLLNLAHPVADYQCESFVDKLIMQKKSREEMRLILQVLIKCVDSQITRTSYDRAEKSIKAARASLDCRNRASNSASLIKL